jgi:hypothetical protein
MHDKIRCPRLIFPIQLNDMREAVKIFGKVLREFFGES